MVVVEAMVVLQASGRKSRPPRGMGAVFRADLMGLCMFSTLLYGPGYVFAWSLCHYAGENAHSHLIEPGRQNGQASKSHIRLWTSDCGCAAGMWLH